MRTTSNNYLDDLVLIVRMRGSKAIAKAGDLDVRTVDRFLTDPMRTRLSMLQRIGRAAGMPVGEIHVINADGKCSICTDPGDEHYPLLPERECGKGAAVQ